MRSPRKGMAGPGEGPDDPDWRQRPGCGHCAKLEERHGVVLFAKRLRACRLSSCGLPTAIFGAGALPSRLHPQPQSLAALPDPRRHRALNSVPAPPSSILWSHQNNFPEPPRLNPQEYPTKKGSSEHLELLNPWEAMELLGVWDPA